MLARLARECQILTAAILTQQIAAIRRAVIAAYNGDMSSDRDRLHALVDALPGTDVQAAISFLAELGEEEIIDAETAARLELARAEEGDDVPLEEVRRRLGL
jgi:hypothetical protein